MSRGTLRTGSSLLLFLILFAACGDSKGSMARAQCVGCHIRNVLPGDELADSFSNGHHPVVMSYYKESPEVLSAKECGKCHKREYDTWKGSSHAKAWTNPAFQMGFDAEPLRWCVHCHAPLSLRDLPLKGTGPPVGEISLRSEGINCAVCHLREGKVFTSREPGEKSRRASIHPIEVSRNLRSSRFCATCHEFNFPLNTEGEVPYRPVPMQSTFSELANLTKHFPQIETPEGTPESKPEGTPEGIPSGKRRCQDCHLPGIKKGDHSFSGAKELLTTGAGETRMQFSFRNHRSSETGAPFLVVRIRLKKAGHCIPTGDLFRSIDMTVENRKGEVVGFYRLERRVDLKSYETVRDSRLCPDPKTGEIDTERYIELSGKPHRCTVEYQRQGAIAPAIRKKISFLLEHDPAALRRYFPDFELLRRGDAKLIRRLYREHFTFNLYSGPCP